RECRYCGELRLSAMKKRRSAPGGRERICKRCQVTSWYSANREKALRYQRDWRADNPESARQHAKAWWDADPERARDARRRRRARLRDASVERFTASEVFERDRYICYLGGCLTSPDLPSGAPLRTVLEHKIPLSRGGEHSRANTATACWQHNAQKGAMTDAEWFASRN